MYRDDLQFKEEVHEIVGAAMSVHRYFGCGFTEKVHKQLTTQKSLVARWRCLSISGKPPSNSNATL